MLMCLVCLGLAGRVHASEVTSPNGEMKLTFILRDSKPYYSVSFRGKPVIKPSRLGYELHNAESLLEGFTQTGRRPRPLTRPGRLSGARIRPSAITTRSCW